MPTPRSTSAGVGRRVRMNEATVPRGASERGLEQLLDEAREASPSTRLPEYRDVIAAFGGDAVEPLATWLNEPVLAAFAIRSLERIASLEADTKQLIVEVLASADRSALTEPLRRDID